MAKKKSKSGESSNAVLIGVVFLVAACVCAILAALLLYNTVNKQQVIVTAALKDTATYKEKFRTLTEQHQALTEEVAGRDEATSEPKSLKPLKDVTGGAPLYDFIASLQKDNTKLKDDLKTAQESGEKLTSELQAARKDKEDIQKGREEELKKLKDLKDTSDKEHLAKIKELEDNLSAVKTERDKLAGDKKSLEEKNQQLVAKYEQELRLVTTQLKSMQNTAKTITRGSKVTVDGRVLETVTSRNFVIVDVGAKDKTKPGTVFDVYSPNDLTGKSKGKVRIARVDDVSSVADIVSLADRLNPILTGDALVSQLFTKGEKETYVLAGDFHQFTKDQIKAMVKEHGGNVADTVNQNTDYLIVGDTYKGEELDKAAQFGAEIIREEKFLKLIGTK